MSIIKVADPNSSTEARIRMRVVDTMRGRLVEGKDRASASATAPRRPAKHMITCYLEESLRCRRGLAQAARGKIARALDKGRERKARSTNGRWKCNGRRGNARPKYAKQKVSAKAAAILKTRDEDI